MSRWIRTFGWCANSGRTRFSKGNETVMQVKAKVSSKIDTPKPEAPVPALDGHRGIAILLVMLNHFFLYGGMQPDTMVDRLFFTVATSGWIGVDLFFVLSGFLITGILLDTKENRHFFRNF